MKKTVSIYGGGWVGAPLAHRLAMSDHPVKVSGSRKRSQASDPNLTEVEFRAESTTTREDWNKMNDGQIQIWAIPPRRKENSEELYLTILQDWISGINANTLEKLIFLSSTSVYKNVPGLVDENSDVNENALLWKAEQLIARSKLPHVILRLGGLMGAERFVAKYFSNRFVDGANCPVNYVHQEDVLELISKIVAKVGSGTYNIVAPEHPAKHEVGESDCMLRNLPMPRWDLAVTCADGKKVSSEKIIKDLKYTFKYPDPRNFPI